MALIVLDGTIVGVALPAIIDDLNLALTEAQWLTSLYAVTFAALLLTCGRLGDRHGRRALFLLGVTIFVAGSLTAAGADDGGELIASRCVQGVGGAMVLPATLSTVNATFRGRDRTLAFGLWGAVMAAAAAIGPLLGGWLTTAASWRWIFLVNLPLGAVILLVGARFVAETRGDQEQTGFDGWGLVGSAVGFGAVIFGLIEGSNLGWLQPTREVGLGPLTWPASAPVSLPLVALLIGTLALGLFLAVERQRLARGHLVILDLSLFGVPTFAWGNLTAVMVAAGEFALLFVLPLYLVYGLDLAIIEAGWVLASMALGAVLAGAAARPLATKLGAPRVVTVGLVLELVSVGVTGVVIAGRPSMALVMVALAVYGLGLGLASAQLTSTVLHDIPLAQSGTASATQSTVRQLGSAFGAALAGTALAASFTLTVPAQLARVAGVSADDAATMIEYMSRTGGAVIGMIRERGTTGFFGPLGPSVADALSVSLAQSSALVAGLAAGFIALGVAGALAVETAARTVQRSKTEANSR
ncbi:MAG: MFS transporter [Micropruina sp.]